MQQHPVPQNVMSVEFQLIGNMTIKQFAFVAVGGILAFIAYSLPLPSFIRWPLVLSFLGGGAATAFAPFNDITLDKWFFSFIRAVYSPTKRVWRKEPKIIEFLLPEFTKFLSQQTTQTSITSRDRTKLQEYLSTLKPTQIRSSLDKLEDTYLTSLDFAAALPQAKEGVPTVPVVQPPLPVEEPRVVEETPSAKPEGERLASYVSFKPVLTVRLPDKSIFVKPISNVRVRSLHPLPALEGTIVLPVRGEKVFTVTDQLKKRLAEKIKPFRLREMGSMDLSNGQITQIKSGQLPVSEREQIWSSPHVATYPPKNPENDYSSKPVKKSVAKIADSFVPKSEAVFPSPQPIPAAKEVGKEISQKLEGFNKETEQIAAQSNESIKQVPYQTITLPPISVPSSTEVYLPKSVQDLKPLNIPELPPLTKTKPRIDIQKQAEELDKANKLLDEQRVQEQMEISKIKGSITSTLSTTMDRFKQVAEQNRRLTEELNRVKQAQDQPQTSASKSELDRIVSDYKSQIERLRAERETLFNQLNKLGEQTKLYQQKATSSTDLEEELEEMKQKLAILEKEKSLALNQSDQLKQSLSSLQTQVEKQVGTIESGVNEQELPVVAPQKPATRIVQPRKAIGRMAPAITNIPNVVNGIVKDKQGLLLPDVVIVVKDKDDIPARALKSNKVGQFAVSTPLPNGTYLIELEKDGYEFDIIEVKLKGDILAPIEIQSK